ncbi:tyrosine-type recombinase/integrase, partial [Nocardia sp. SYP-A9097]|uniref:tyrosine-type recombinase/integrase n=1 Tax=Nocardia sp. SYP-A9097 TaxID=2663237 RepID=UPI00129BC118
PMGSLDLVLGRERPTLTRRHVNILPSGPLVLRIRCPLSGGSLRPVFLADYLDDIFDIVPGVASRHYVVLSGTFKMLTLAGLFDVSPMAPVPRPERCGGGQRALFPHERDQLYELICERVTRTRYFRLLFLTILGTGIRPGEAFPLWWSDVCGLDDITVEKAVLRVGATAVKPMSGGPVFRQNKRKHGKEGAAYYITLPRWLTAELREYKRLCAPESEDTPVFLSRLKRMVEPMGADQNLMRARVGSAVDWVTWGNLRDTVATHVVGRTGDRQRASAQLGHSEGASVAASHYIDQAGYVHVVVDNSEVLEELAPSKVGAKLEFGGSVNPSE